jgi:tRNA-uridine 2-sulfurtransferase
MSENARVAVAMSGGVDSSVAALLLKKQGFDVFGLTLVLSGTGPEEEVFLNSVKGVAGELDLELHVRDLRNQFRTDVIGYFITAYENGLTPNPCVVCNQTIKFGTMLAEARKLGADYLATGHYIRMEKRGNLLHLLKGVDKVKDQSYFLYRLNQDRLNQLLFPLGNYQKKQIREIAREHRLQPADKKESQDLCFIVDGDYRELLHRESNKRLAPGPIIDSQGKVVGTHTGLWNYTIGQRRGLGVAASEPMYVTTIDMEKNSLIIAKNNERGLKSFEVDEVNYINGSDPVSPFSAQVKIRYTANSVDAFITPLTGKRVTIELSKSLPDVTPGQSAVFYNGEELLGGGIIQ